MISNLIKYTFYLFLASVALIAVFYFLGAEFWAKYSIIIVFISLIIYVVIGSKILNEYGGKIDSRKGFWTYFSLIFIPFLISSFSSFYFIYFFANYIDPAFFKVEVVDAYKNLLIQKDILFTNYQGKDYLSKIINQPIGVNKYSPAIIFKKGISILFLISIMASILAKEKKVKKQI